MIPIIKPFLPPCQKYQKYVREIWKRNILTNNGPLVKEFEEKLKKYLDLQYLIYVSNGTIALHIAIEALGLNGEIITTPLSHVATTSSIVWKRCKPVFTDIDPNTLTIDPELIEPAITKRTSAILSTHVYGNPCDIDAIQKIANKYNLKVIYDASHCFGTTYKKRSVYKYGDISTTSFHATKLFHTTEGGAVFTKHEALFNRMKRIRNFGHVNSEKFDGAGINGKNSEFHAAMGLCNLYYINKILSRHKKQVNVYNRLLQDAPVKTLTIQKNSEWNYSYYPVIFKNEKTLLRVKTALEKNGIYPRRYFFPSLDTLSYVHTKK